MVPLAPRLVASLALLVALSVAAACGAERGPPAGGSGSAAGSGAPAGSGSAEREASEHPVITLDAKEIRLDGAVVDSLAAAEKDGRPVKLDALFEALKRRREAFRLAHAEQPFPGTVGLHISGDPSMLAFKSAFSSAVYAGYPYAKVRGIPGVEGDVALNAQIPGPPARDDRPEPEGEVRSLHVHLSGTTARLVWRTPSEKDAPESVVSSALLASAVCEQWATQGAHKLASDRKLDQAVLHVPNDERLAVLAPAISALRACKRPLDGEPSPISVFTLTFAMN